MFGDWVPGGGIRYLQVLPGNVLHPGVVCLLFGGGVHPLEVHGAAWAAVLLGGNDHAAQPRDWSAHWHRLDDAEPNIAIDVSLYLILPMVWNWHWRVYCLGLSSFL